MTFHVTIIIPAHNEADYILPCLDALLGQDADAGAMLVIVAANGCSDDTVIKAGCLVSSFAARGSELRVMNIKQGGKVKALNAAETGLQSGPRIYLDADVICDPALVGQLVQALSSDQPLYGTGTLTVAPARSWITRAYARLWQELPFVKGGTVGAGLFAVSAQGRARWGTFPEIISDDTFVRLNFAATERIEVPARYYWPMIEGFAGLVRVRRRQDAGVNEVRRKFPALIANDQTGKISKGDAMRLALRMPVAFMVYLAVHLAVRTRRGQETDWARGR